MENDNAELYGGGVEYDNYYENSGWYQDEYGEWYQDPNYAAILPNGSIPNGTGTNKSQATINNHNVIQSGTTSANNKSMQNKPQNPKWVQQQEIALSKMEYLI